MEFSDGQKDFNAAESSGSSRSGSVGIEMEHAYATGVIIEGEDPLRLSEETHIPEIKTEIKMEDIEIKQEETESLETEYSPETEYYENMDTSLCNVPLTSSLSVETEKYSPFNVESVPKDVYMELQENLKSTVERLSNANSLIESLGKKNMSLKLEISKLRKQQRQVDSSINEKSKLFYNDLQKMNEKHTDLQIQLKSLRDENMIYKKRLYACISHESTNNALERSIDKLKKQAHSFIDLEKQAITNIKFLKNKMDEKEQENRAARMKLASAMKQLAVFQKKFVEYNKRYSKKLKLATDLQLNMRIMIDDHKAKSTNWATETHNLKLALKQEKETNAKKDAELSLLKKSISLTETTCKSLEVATACKDVEISNLKNCLNIARESIKNKDSNLKIVKTELDKSRAAISQKETTIKVLKDKHNYLMNNFDRKVKENNQEVIKVRQKLIDYKTLTSQKHLECENLKANVNILKEEIQKSKTKSCDYCGL